MADKICPPVRNVPVADGIKSPESHSILSTPNQTFGRYYGAGEPGADAVNSQSIMGKK